ncbi:MAG: menaquinone biosynthesis protein [Bacillota bacterium]
MTPVRLGQVDYLNCLPIYYAFEQGLVDTPVEVVKGPPTRLNGLFLRGELEITPLSSIEYARHPDRCLIVPGLSISSDGPVGSIFLMSKVPLTELDGKKVCLPDTSASAVALLKILFHYYYHVDVQYETTASDLERMLARADAALLIGDEALAAYRHVRETEAPLVVVDLGEAWKKFTGERMVFAVWAVRRDYALAHRRETAGLVAALQRAREIGIREREAVLDLAVHRTGLPRDFVADYLKLVRHDFDADYQRGLLTFYDYAYKTGLTEERVRLVIWGEHLA